MVVGVPKEIKVKEGRVAITPAGVKALTIRNHQVLVEKSAGIISGFSDENYENAGAQIVETPSKVYDIAKLIVKVKEPLEQEFELIKPHHTVFTYFHFAASQKLTEAMTQSGATCIAYETITSQKGDLPLLTPMSQIAGRLSAQEASRFLMMPNGGKGKLFAGVPGVLPAKVVVLGAGVVGTEAAKIAAGMGADVYLLDINQDRLNDLALNLPKNIKLLFSSQHVIESLLPEIDVVIGAVLVPGGKAPRLITKEMLLLMQKGSVLVDVAVDQGGCIETVKPTTHEDPVYKIDDVVHYGVANMPGSVPQTATQALTNTTLPYIIKLANKGWEQYAEEDLYFKEGVNISGGKVLNREVKEAFGL